MVDTVANLQKLFKGGFVFILGYLENPLSRSLSPDFGHFYEFFHENAIFISLFMKNKNNAYALLRNHKSDRDSKSQDSHI